MKFGTDAAPLALVVYAYPGDYNRLRSGAPLGLRQLCSSNAVRVFVTVRDGEAPPLLELPDAIPMVLSHPAGYEFLPDKTIAMLRWFIKHTQCSHLMKVDTDVVLDRHAVEQLASSLSSCSYEGVGVWEYSPGSANLRYHQGRCKTPELNGILLDARWSEGGCWFATGKCYLLSRSAIQDALGVYDRGPFEVVAGRELGDSRAFQEDVMLGYLMQRAGYLPRHSLQLLHLPAGSLESVSFALRWILARVRRRAAPGRVIGCVSENQAMTRWQRLIARSVMLVRRLSRSARALHAKHA